jgi:hypothetical protein
MSRAMRISPRYTVDDWRTLQFHNEEDWNTGIEIFEDRIRGRFLNIINAIQDNESAGFAVLALDCLLIEALMQFRTGTEATPQRDVATYFRRFLTETSFRDYFAPKTADLFYRPSDKSSWGFPSDRVTCRVTASWGHMGM